MKEIPFARNLHVWLLGTLLLGGALPSQAGLDTKLRDVLDRMQHVISGAVDKASLDDAIAAAQAYSEALGESGERRACDLLIEDLQRHTGGPWVLADESVTRLLDEVMYQRTRGRPERMLPALFALNARYPDDARVLYTLGEAYGVASAVFDADRARAAFKRLLDALRENSEVATDPVGRGRSLVQFLPELSRAGLLLKEKTTDTTARMRQQLLKYCDTLAGGRPIGLWRLADPQMDRLFEQLSLARESLDQNRCREVLEAMLEMQPVNPVLQFALAEVHLSRGPAFSRKGARRCLEEFLALTDPATLSGPRDGRSSRVAASDIVVDLDRFRLAKPRSDLEAQRLDAHKYVGLLQKTIKRMEDGLLLSPDKRQIVKEITALEKAKTAKAKRNQSTEKYLGSALRNVAKYEAAAANPRIPANIRGQHRQKVRQWKRRAAGYEAKINEVLREIGELEGRIGELREVLPQ